MNQLERDVLKDLAHFVVDKALPSLIAAEEQRLPAAYQPLVKAVVDAMLPALQQKLDAFIDEKFSQASAPQA